MTEIVRKAPGTHVLAGLSGGGGAAAYAGQATLASGSALYARQLLLAPYIDVAIIGPALTPIENLGLGEIKVDFGAALPLAPLMSWSCVCDGGTSFRGWPAARRC